MTNVPQDTPPPVDENQDSATGCVRNFLIIFGVIVATCFVTVWLVFNWLFPNRFDPVELTQGEQQVLTSKLEMLSPALTKQGAPDTNNPAPPPMPGATGAPDNETLTPRPYSEKGAPRVVQFTEREINALIARDETLADKLVIDLSDNLASAEALIPLPEPMPIVGGRTLKIHTGVELRYADGRPVVILKGVSLWGVPLPAEWLGNLKNIDLAERYDQPGAWQSLLAGIDNVTVEEGKVTVKLKE